jgi:hypothetical protein
MTPRLDQPLPLDHEFSGRIGVDVEGDLGDEVRVVILRRLT